MSGLAPATGGAAAVRPAQASGAPARPGSQEPGGDLFASLLLQVSDGQGTDEAAPDETATHATGLPVPAEPPWPGAGTTADFLPGFGRDTPPSHAAGHTPPAAPHGRAESAGLAWPPAPGSTALPPGLSPTQGAEALDADTAAALALAEQASPAGAPGKPAHTAAPLAAGKDGTPAGPAPAHATGTGGPQGLNWRRLPATGDTRGLDGARRQAGTGAPGAPTPSGAAAQAAAARAAVRSTVALHERFGAAFGADLAAADATTTGSPPGWASALGAASPTAAEARSAAPGLTADPGRESGPADTADAAAEPPGSAADAAAQAAEDEARQISHWGTQTLRHASLRVGQAGDEAIDIRLSLAGQAVQVDFLTDSAEVRTSLQQHAGEALAHLLQRSGMQLGGVSVGAQGQGSGTDPRGSERPRHPGRTAGVGGPAAAAAEPTRRTGMAAPRADGSQPLDVFA